jgi:hypothetical protein
MNNILENVIATVIVIALSTVAELALQAFGFSTQSSISIAGVILCALAVLFLVFRKCYPAYMRWLTKRLLAKALNINDKKTNETNRKFKEEIIEQVLKEAPHVVSKQNSSVIEFPNQVSCEDHIRTASSNAQKVKILTIRGKEYFLGPKSLLYNLFLSKQAKNINIKALVLLPKATHITDELSRNLGHASAEEIREDMHLVLDNMKFLARRNKNFEVRCYNETPYLKILIFDDVMFVSSFAEDGGPKNDQNAKMWQMTREDNPVFTGLERHFDELWKRSVPP